MRSFALILVGLTAACGPNAGDYIDGGTGADGDGGDGIDAGRPGPDEFADAAPQKACANMDVLFVVDNSASMSDEQASLTANFPLFVSVLDEFEVEGGGFLDYRIAVTTTGMDATPTYDPLPGVVPPITLPQSGDNGAFRQGCGMMRPWIERDDGNVASTFECIASVGTGGPDVEMQLSATTTALTLPGQTDFVRDDALLAIVILSDEDDCSIENNQPFTVPDDGCKPRPPEMLGVDHYIAQLDSIKTERGRWAAAVIAGDSTCPDSFNDGERLREFATTAGDNVIHRPICVSDLSSALQDAVEKFEAACEAIPPVL